MRRRLVAVMAAAVVVTAPVVAAPAQASEGPFCDSFKPPYDGHCETVIRVWCMLTRDNPICHI